MARSPHTAPTNRPDPGTSLPAPSSVVGRSTLLPAPLEGAYFFHPDDGAIILAMVAAVENRPIITSCPSAAQAQRLFDSAYAAVTESPA